MLSSTYSLDSDNIFQYCLGAQHKHVMQHAAQHLTEARIGFTGCLSSELVPTGSLIDVIPLMRLLTIRLRLFSSSSRHSGSLMSPRCDHNNAKRTMSRPPATPIHQRSTCTM